MKVSLVKSKISFLLAILLLVGTMLPAAPAAACDTYGDCFYCRLILFAGWVCWPVRDQTGHCECTTSGPTCIEFGDPCGTIEPPPFL